MMEPLYRHIGDNIRTIRKKQNVTQAIIAEEINVSPSHFSGMERGVKRFSIAQLVTISNFLKVPMISLLSGITEAESQVDLSKVEDPVVRQAAQEFLQIISKCSHEEIDGILLICRTCSERLLKKT